MKQKKNGKRIQSLGVTTDEIMYFLKDHMVVKEEFEKRMGGVEDRMGGVEDRMGGVEDRMGGIEERMTNLEGDVKILKGDIQEVKKHLTNVENQVQGVRNLLQRHLEISDDRYFEVRKKNELYDYWFEKIAGKLKIKLDIPVPLAQALKSV